MEPLECGSSAGRRNPTPALFFPFGASWKLFGFALHLTKKPRMQTRVGLVLLAKTSAKWEVCMPLWACVDTKKTTHSSALSHAANLWRKGFLSRGGKTRQFSWSGMISFFASALQKSSVGARWWKGHTFPACEPWGGGGYPNGEQLGSSPVKGSRALVLTHFPVHPEV